MKDNLNELVFLLDQSASIEKWIDEAPLALQELLEKQSKQGLETNVTISIFGSEYQVYTENSPIDSVRLRGKPFETSGVCPFIDSLHSVIDSVGERLAATDENQRPSKIIVTAVVFGRDNASKIHTYEKLAQLIRQQTYVYKWEFFLVTDFSIIMEKLNIPEDHTVIFKRDNERPFFDAYRELNRLIDKCRMPEESREA